MRLKHNKKRNTAFLFECLVKELAKACFKKDQKEKVKIAKIIKESFNNETLLGRELSLYRALYETKEIDTYSAEKIMIETKKQYEKLNQKSIFNEQTNLINKINRSLSGDVWDNFIPNYKSLATIYQIFNPKTNVKTKVILENNVLMGMISKKQIVEEQEIKPIDDLVLKKFITKFNDKYGNKLLENQKKLLSNYITCAEGPSSSTFKMYIAEELDQIKSVIDSFERKNDNFPYKEKLQEAKRLIDSFQKKNIDEQDLKRILALQNLAEELK